MYRKKKLLHNFGNSQNGTVYIIKNQQYKGRMYNVDQNLIADQRKFRAKYLQSDEENWT